MKLNIYRRKDGRFEGRLAVGKKADGKIVYKYVYAYSYEECSMRLKMLQDQTINGTISPAATATFQNISYQWLSSVRVYTKESTCALYAYVLRKYLMPAFGKNKLYMIDEATIKTFINKLLTQKSHNEEKPLSVTSVRNIMTILKMIFTFAERKYFILNPTKNIRIIKNTLRKKFLSDENWQLICQAIRCEENDTTTAIAIAGYMGLRIGEICALQKKDVDLDNNILTVQKTVQRISNPVNGKKTRLIIGEPKTSTSRRFIPIPDILVERIAHICQKRETDDFLFGIDGKVLDPRTLQYRFKKFLQKNNIPVINFHQLRHKFAGRCVEKNVDIKVLSEILGHSNVNITLNYYVHPTMSFKRKQLNMAMTEL